MKFIHMADMHFDAPFTNLSDKENFGSIRRMEQRAVFKKIIDYIKDNDIKYLFISGDLYEHQHIRNTTINYINNLFKEIPNTKIFISPGNHDPYLNNSIYANFNWNNNVIIFNSNIKKYSYEDVDIYGYGFTDFYCENSIINNLKIENKNKINILVMHANLDQISDKKYNEVKTKDLDKLGFDYIALGHIHKRNFDDSMQENIIYPGSTLALGFDEQGKHGIIEGEINNKDLKLKFIPLDEKEFNVINLDVTEIISKEELIEKINNLELIENNYYEIIFVGRRNFEINKYEINKFIIKNNVIKLKDNTKTNIDINKLINENTLKGLFVKELSDRINNETNEENKKILEEALEIGLEVFDK